MPAVFAFGRTTAVAFFGARGWSVKHHPDWADGIVGVRFHGVESHCFGAPDENTIRGHPLAEFGLEPYGFARVLHSPWIESLRLMSAVHEHHRDQSFDVLQHFILPFHDETFECVARGYTVETADAAGIKPAGMVRALVGK